LIIVEYVLEKDIHAFILEGSKGKNWVFVTQKVKSASFMKEGHYIRDNVLFKEWLESKGI